jgi:hypothetical protein
MQKEPLSLIYRKILQQDIRKTMKTWNPILRNGWVIKFSIYREENILLVFTSKHTGQTFIRYFNEENDAVTFINFVCDVLDSNRVHFENSK